MQIQMLTYTKFMFLTALVIGGFVFATPVSALAGSTLSAPDMDGMSMDMGMNESIGCGQQGCVQTHVTCDRHCVRQAPDQTILAVASISQQNQSSPNFLPQRFRMTVAIQTLAFAPATDPGSPPHLLLRSIVKRE